MRYTTSGAIALETLTYWPHRCAPRLHYAYGCIPTLLSCLASGGGLLKWAAKAEPKTNGAAKTDAPQVSKANLIAFMACFWEIPAANASVLTHTRLSLLHLLLAA